MSTLTRGNLLDRIEELTGDDDAAFRTYMETSFNHVLFQLYDLHDWEFKHKSGQFVTVSGTEEYDLSAVKRIYHGAVTGGPFQIGETITGGSSAGTGLVLQVNSTFLLYTALTGALVTSEVLTGGTSAATATTLTAPEGGVASVGDIRSVQDIEFMYDQTNGTPILKVDLRDIRRAYPKHDTTGKPKFYAPWGTKTIVLSDEPDGAYTMKFLYGAKATKSTSDSDDLEEDLGIPDYLHYLFEEMLIAKAYQKYDDSRWKAQLDYIGNARRPDSLVFNAIQADMKHFESGARFKFWEEELGRTGDTYQDFIRRIYNSDD